MKLISTSCTILIINESDFVHKSLGFQTKEVQAGSRNYGTISNVGSFEKEEETELNNRDRRIRSCFDLFFFSVYR